MTLISGWAVGLGVLSFKSCGFFFGCNLIKSVNKTYVAVGGVVILVGPWIFFFFIFNLAFLYLWNYLRLLDSCYCLVKLELQ